MKRERGAACFFGRFLALGIEGVDRLATALLTARAARIRLARLSAAVSPSRLISVETCELLEIDFFVFEERPLRVVDVRRMDNAVDQSRAGGISGSGVLGCSCACFGFTPMIAKFVPSLSDVLSFQCAGMRNVSDDLFVLFSCVIALLSICPIFLRGADEFAVALYKLGNDVELQRRLSTASMVALSDPKTWTRKRPSPTGCNV